MSKDKTQPKKAEEKAEYVAPEIGVGRLVAWWPSPAHAARADRLTSMSAGFVAQVGVATLDVQVLVNTGPVTWLRLGVRHVSDPFVPRAQQIEEDFPGVWDYHPHDLAIQQRLAELEARITFFEGPQAK